MKDREANKAIAKLIADNAGTITRNLNGLLHRNVQDLITGGIGRDQVADCAFNVGVTHKAAVIGPGAMSALLRDLADVFEQLAGKNAEPPLQ